MKTSYDYESAFADNIRKFIEFKASMGVASNSRSWHLYDFDLWCVANGATEFDKDTVEGWVLWRKSKTSPQHSAKPSQNSLAATPVPSVPSLTTAVAQQEHMK